MVVPQSPGHRASARVLGPRYSAVLFPAVIILPAVVVTLVAWRLEPSRAGYLLLLVPVLLLLVLRLGAYALVRQHHAGVVITTEGVTWTATSYRLTWDVVARVEVNLLARGWALVGLFGSVVLVDQRAASSPQTGSPPTVPVINLKYVDASVEEVRDAIGQFAPYLVIDHG